MVLCMNVTAGIGVLEQASPMIQEMFPKVVGANGEVIKHGVTAAAAGGFVARLSLFNMAGRFVWSSLSDYIGRKNVYVIYLLLGAILYSLIPLSGHTGSTALFIGLCVVILSMYGGGFATIPAYLKDLFGGMQVGAIHGRLLTAWSVAGIVGPVLIAGVREAQLNAGVQKTLVYDRTLYILAGLLLVGLICNLLVRPVDPKHHMTEEELARERSLQHESATSAEDLAAVARGRFGAVGVLAWLGVGIPFLVGVWIALAKAAALL